MLNRTLLKLFLVCGAIVTLGALSDGGFAQEDERVLLDAQCAWKRYEVCLKILPSRLLDPKGGKVEVQRALRYNFGEYGWASGKLGDRVECDRDRDAGLGFESIPVGPGEYASKDGDNRCLALYSAPSDACPNGFVSGNVRVNKNVAGGVWRPICAMKPQEARTVASAIDCINVAFLSEFAVQACGVKTFPSIVQIRKHAGIDSRQQQMECRYSQLRDKVDALAAEMQSVRGGATPLAPTGIPSLVGRGAKPASVVFRSV